METNSSNEYGMKRRTSTSSSAFHLIGLFVDDSAVDTYGTGILRTLQS